jgi:FtsZ-interacting cell division protein ZipA
MDQNATVIVVAVVVAIAAVVAWLMWQRQRSSRLRQRFGSEYEREVSRAGDVRSAEAELAAREKRVSRLQIHPLPPDEARRFAQAWRTIQTQFVDDPRGAVREADKVVGEVMLARGYPVGDFEQQVADISVDHPDVVINYRAARDIAEAHARGEASTEELRQAMVHYRALFRDLLDLPQHEAAESDTTPARRI